MVKQEKLAAVTKRTEALMEIEKDTRDSDKLLLVRYMKVYHNIDISGILRPDVPCIESIRRSRQLIQSFGKCLPAEKVKGERSENEVAYSDYYGVN